MVAARGLSIKRQRELKALLTAGLLERSIHGQVNLQPAGPPDRYRLVVVAPEFAGLAEAERQDLIWLVLEERWPREDRFRLTMTLCLSHDEPAPGRRRGPT